MRDLRDFIDALEREYPDEIVRIDKGPLNPAEGECIALLYHLMKLGKRPMALFERVTNLNGGPWQGSLAIQSAGTWTKVGCAYGIPRQENTFQAVQEETLRRLDERVKPLKVDTSQAPVKHTVLEGEEASLFDLPAYIANEKEARPGNLPGVLVVKDPDSGRYNVSWHRTRVLEPLRMTISVDNPARHAWALALRYAERGEEWMPACLVYGHHPLFAVAAAAQVGLEVDEGELAGGMIGEPLRVTPSATWGGELLIPADAEVVVEGYISNRAKEEGGLWGDEFRYYVAEVGSYARAVMRVTAINMRERPIFELPWVGHYVYTDLAYSCFLRSWLASRFPGVGAVNHAAPGVDIIQFKPIGPNDGRRLAAMAHAVSTCKHVIIVDADIDPFDLAQVLWSIGSRVDASKRVWIDRGLSVRMIDPSAKEGFLAGEGVGGFIIDSTTPVGRPFAEVAYPAPEVLDRVNLQDYLSVGEVERLATGHTTRPWAKF